MGKYKERVCAKCGRIYIPKDRYCRFCGTPMGLPEFIEQDDGFICANGPEAVKRLHICVQCGHMWKTELMVDEQRYCPICGGRAPALKKKDWTSVFYKAVVSKVKKYNSFSDAGQ